MLFISSFTVRLVNGSTIYEGRVEVQHNGIWRTVCDYGWDLHDAQVVCSQLGFGRAIAAKHNSFYGDGSGQTWLTYLNCIGNELTIGNCLHRGWYYRCSLGNHAGVKCSSGTYVIKDLISPVFFKQFYYSHNYAHSKTIICLTSIEINIKTEP